MSIFNKNQSLLSASIENTQGTESQQEKKEQQEKLLDMMQMYQTLYKVALHVEQYVLRRSVLSCDYGTKYALLDLLKDHGILEGDLAVCTIKDSKVENIHDFGVCKCPEKFYKDKLPMAGGYDIYGNPVEKEPYNEFAHVCMPSLDEQEWKQANKKVLAVINGKEYVPMLLDDAILPCQRGGKISIKEVPDVETEEKKQGSRITYLTDEYMTWWRTAEGNEDYIYNPFRVMSDKDERVTIGHGITFARLKEGDLEEEKRWKILQECFGWSEDDMNHIIGCLFDNEEPAAGGEVKEYYEGEGEQRELKNIYYTKYKINEDQEKKAFELVKWDYIAKVNKAISMYEDTFPKKERGEHTNYAQHELEAMFDVTYNQGLKLNADGDPDAKIDIDNTEKIIYYYLDLDEYKETVKAKAVVAVENYWEDVDKRRRINQMYLYFKKCYDFKDDYIGYAKDLGFKKVTNP